MIPAKNAAIQKKTPMIGLGSENQPSVLTIVNQVVTKCDPSATGYIEIQPGVTAIAENAFSNCIYIKGVIIPEGVTSIGYRAFRYCSDMLSVEVPGSVTYIGDNAFEYCNKLEMINFSGTLDQLTALGLDTKVNDINKISVTCYYGKPGEGQCHYVEKGDETLTGYVIIPSNVTELSSETSHGAFQDCKGIIGIGIPNSVTYIELAFRGCTGLTEIIISNSVIAIGDSTFSGCSSLTEVTIPNSVTHIGYAAFRGSGLTKITIPNSVISINTNAFSCGSLTSIIFDGTQAQWKSITKWNSWDSDTGDYTIYCTDGTISKS